MNYSISEEKYITSKKVELDNLISLILFEDFDVGSSSRFSEVCSQLHKAATIVTETFLLSDKFFSNFSFRVSILIRSSNLLLNLPLEYLPADLQLKVIIFAIACSEIGLRQFNGGEELVLTSLSILDYIFSNQFRYASLIHKIFDVSALVFWLFEIPSRLLKKEKQLDEKLFDRLLFHFISFLTFNLKTNKSLKTLLYLLTSKVKVGVYESLLFNESDLINLSTILSSITSSLDKMDRNASKKILSSYGLSIFTSLLSVTESPLQTLSVKSRLGCYKAMFNFTSKDKFKLVPSVELSLLKLDKGRLCLELIKQSDDVETLIECLNVFSTICDGEDCSFAESNPFSVIISRIDVGAIGENPMTASPDVFTFTGLNTKLIFAAVQFLSSVSFDIFTSIVDSFVSSSLNMDVTDIINKVIYSRFTTFLMVFMQLLQGEFDSEKRSYLFMLNKKVIPQFNVLTEFLCASDFEFIPTIYSYITKILTFILPKGLLSPITVNTVLNLCLNVTKTLDDLPLTVHTFSHLFSLLHKVLTQCLQSQTVSVLNSVEVYILVIKSMQYNIVQFGRLDRKNNRITSSVNKLRANEIEELVECAGLVERLFTLMISHKLEFHKVVIDIIADYLHSIQNITLDNTVKKSLSSVIFKSMSLFDEHAPAHLHVVLPSGQREIFKSLYDEYTKFYKYKGHV